MIVLLSLLCLWTGEDVGTIGLDELDIGKLGSIGSYKGRAVFSYSKGVSMVFPILLFDFETEKLRQIKDGRIPAILPYVVPLEEGFALFNRITAYRSKIFYVDREGAFWKTGRTTDLPGWDENLKLIHVAPEKPGRAYLTFKHQQDPTLVLALVDLNQNKLDYLSSLKLDPDDSLKRFWTTDIERLFLVTRQSGRIDLISKDNFQVLQTLRKAHKTVRRKDKRLRALVGPDLNILSAPNFNGQYLSFKYLKCYDRFGNGLDEPRVMSLSLTNKGPRERQYSVLAIHQKKKLVYHWEDQELRIFPHMKNE